RRCETIRDGLHVLRAAGAPTPRWSEAELHIRRRADLGLNTEGAVTVSLAIASDLPGGVDHDALAGIGVHAREPVVALRPTHDGTTAGQPVVENCRPVNPVGAPVPVVERLQLTIQLHLPVRQIALEIVLLLAAADEQELPVPRCRLGPQREDIRAHPDI